VCACVCVRALSCSAVDAATGLSVMLKDTSTRLGIEPPIP